MAGVIPQAETQFLDDSGNPLVAGTVGHYIPNTLTAKLTWQDEAGTIPNTNPVVLDGGGRALIFGNGLYRQIVKDSLGNVIWDRDVAVSSVDFGVGRAVSVPTIDALRSLSAATLSVNFSAIVSEYATGTGKGGGQFWWNSSSTQSDNGATIINVIGNAGPGRLVRNFEIARAEDWGIVGDGSDETVKTQAFLDWCRDNNRAAHFGNLKVTITGPLVSSKTAILFDMPSFATLEPGFYPTGSGYTALTVSGVVSDFCVAIIGVGNAVNGIDFGSTAGGGTFLALSYIRYVRCWNLAGRGVLGVAPQNSVFEHLSIEFCGTASGYAFALTDNPTLDFVPAECVFHHIEPEQCNQSIIYVSPNTLACVFTKIHAERCAFDSATQPIPFDFAGANCEYTQMRLTGKKIGSFDGIGKVVFRGQSVGYRNVRMEADPGASIAQELRVNDGSALFENALFTNLSTGVGHNTPCMFTNCRVSGTASMIDTPGTVWNGGSIATLALSQSGGPATLVSAARNVYRDVAITAVTLTGNPGATFSGGTVGSIGIGGSFIYDGVTMPGNFSIGFQTWEARNCRFLGNLELDFTTGQGRLINSDVAGNLALASGSSALVNVNSRIAGLVATGFNAAPTVGTWVVGERHYRVAPTVGQPKSWVVTVPGTPGTWTSEGNL